MTGSATGDRGGKPGRVLDNAGQTVTDIRKHTLSLSCLLASFLCFFLCDSAR